MRHIGISKAVAIVLAASTFPTVTKAADLLTSAPQELEAPDPITTTDWGGFYLGGYGGYKWVSPISGNLPDTDGLTAGAYAGFNWQGSENWVSGVETTIGFGDVNGSANGNTLDEDWNASLRGRWGYAYEQSLFYGFAGLALSDTELTTAAGSDSELFTGWNLGAGYETKLQDNVTARIEYGFSDYSDETLSPGGAPTTINLEDQEVRLGIGINF